MNSQWQHDQALEDLVLHPHKMGIEGGRMIIGKEVRFLDHGRIRAEPDIVVIQNGICTLVEYKRTHTRNSFEKAKEQLNRAETYLRYHGFKYDDIRKMYVPGDSNPQVIL